MCMWTAAAAVVVVVNVFSVSFVDEKCRRSPYDRSGIFYRKHKAGNDLVFV